MEQETAEQGTSEKPDRISKRRVTLDFFLSLFGVALMHGILQFWFYPQLNRVYGPEMMGKILFLISFMSIFVIALGTALDNSRLVTRSRFKTLNGDFNRILVLFSALAVGICLPAAWYVFPQMNLAVFALWVILTLVRFYSAVEFRLNINTWGYFTYHFFLSLGYGVGAYFMAHGLDWIWAFCLGEAAALFYVFCIGSIYRKPFWKTANLKKTFRSTSILAGAGILSQGGQNLDRILLPAMIGALANTQFYVVSLLGKIISMFVVPMNSVLISYLCKENVTVRRSAFLWISLAVCVFSTIFFFLCLAATPLFLRTFYRDIYADTANLISIAVLGQILGFASSILLTVVLKTAKESWQFWLQLLYAAVFLILVFPCTYQWHLWGFALAILCANAVRLLATFTLGAVKTGGQSTSITKNETSV